MAGNDFPDKPKKDCTDEPDPDLIMHIRSLGLLTVEDYRGWCVQHGFSRRTDKHWKVRLKERSYAHRAIADARLAQKKQEVKKPDKIIDRIFTGEIREEHVTQPHFKALCRTLRSVHEYRHTRLAFHNLLQHVGACSDLVSNQRAIDEIGWADGNTYLDGLLAVARQAKHWRRLPTLWKPQSHNVRRQFASLARHLFAEWPVPSFMDSVWFLGHSKEAVRRQGWFLHIGRGENIRTADLPLLYTKRMAHCFMQAPSGFTADAALRWGQIHALGGDARLVKATLGTQLGNCFEHDEFWTTVLRFFIANPMLDSTHVGPIIDYINFQRFVSRNPLPPPCNAERRGPAQPNFTMKGRSPASLLRQVAAWHRTLANVEQPKIEWPSSGISGLEYIEGSERSGNLRIWTIRELLSTKALFAEGRAMKHCVASYARSCARGACSIWALEVDALEGHSKVLTIQVDSATRLICQSRGKCNRLPGEKERGILRRWAQQANLRLSSHV
jgi:PcfJ-like protein